MKEKIVIECRFNWIEEGPPTHPGTILENRILDRSIVAWYAARLCLITNKKVTYRKLLHDYTRLAHMFLSITDGIKLGWKSPMSNYQNKVVSQIYGFATVEALLRDCMRRINSEGLHNFKVNNLRKFYDKLQPFRSFATNREAALESLISKKFGTSNNFQNKPRRKRRHRRKSSVE